MSDAGPMIFRRYAPIPLLELYLIPYSKKRKKGKKRKKKERKEKKKDLGNQSRARSSTRKESMF